MFVVYVLYSETHDKIYIGFTSNLIARFHSHNFLGTKGWTIKFRPWMVVLVEFFDLKKDAQKRENELKSAQGRLFIRKHIIPRFF